MTDINQILKLALHKNLLGLDPEINIFISLPDGPNEQPSQGTEKYFSNLAALYNHLGKCQNILISEAPLYTIESGKNFQL